MLKDYRKRFIVLNMLMTGIIILLVLIAIGIYMYNDYYSDIKFTMEQVLKTDRELDHNHFEDRPPLPLDGTGWEEREGEKLYDDMPKAEMREEKAPDFDKNVIQADYCKIKNTISVKKNDADINEELIAACVLSAIEADKDFGVLVDCGYFYLLEEDKNEYSIALLDTGYLTESMVKLSFILLLIFIGAMGVFLLINIYTSKVSLKPLERSLELEKQFVCDVSHDLKTPITVILANSSILKECESLSFNDQLKWINSTEESAKGMLGMINDMLTLSSLDSISSPLDIKRADISSIVTKAALQMESVAYDNNIEYDIDITPDVYAETDASMLQTTVSCLIDNALKYEPEGGNVIVSLCVQKRKAQIAVMNKNSYIPEEALPHIFERFYRADSSRSLKKGHGLGLSVAKRSIELLGGTISVQSTKAEGTVFRITFPLSNE